MILSFNRLYDVEGWGFKKGNGNALKIDLTTKPGKDTTCEASRLHDDLSSDRNRFEVEQVRETITSLTLNGSTEIRKQEIGSYCGHNLGIDCELQAMSN